MKFLKLIPLLLGAIVIFSYSPVRDNIYYTEYEPVVINRSELDKSVKLLTPQVMDEPGKIYMKDNYIYIVEKYKGIHVVDNTDRSKPERIAFIQILGCVDLAIKGNALLADNATDLISLDISNPSKVVLTERVRNIFPELTPPDMDAIPYTYQKENRPDNTVIIAWKRKYDYY